MNKFDAAFKAVFKQTFTMLDGRCEITRQHNRGWPFTREHFIHRVTADKATLIGLCLCDESWFPVGRKRTSWSFPDGWALKAVRGSRWQLTLRDGGDRPNERQRRADILINCCKTFALCAARKDEAFQAFLAGVVG